MQCLCAEARLHESLGLTLIYADDSMQACAVTGANLMKHGDIETAALPFRNSRTLDTDTRIPELTGSHIAYDSVLGGKLRDCPCAIWLKAGRECRDLHMKYNRDTMAISRRPLYTRATQRCSNRQLKNSKHRLKHTTPLQVGTPHPGFRSLAQYRKDLDLVLVR